MSVGREVDARGATAALAASKAAFAGLLGGLPGATLSGYSGVRWVDTGQPDTAFNGVYRTDPGEAGWDTAVGRVTAHFRQRGLPFHWPVGLGEEPARVGDILARHGLRHDGDEPGMWLDLGARPGDRSTVAGLEIRPVSDEESLRQWMWVWGCGAPEEVTERWYQVYRALPFGPDTALRMFVGHLDGSPAATVYLFLAAGVAAVRYVVTRPEFRRRGLGAAMTELAVREARAAGYHVAVLTASSLGINIYRRLGFRQSCLVTSYVWYP